MAFIEKNKRVTTPLNELTKEEYEVLFAIIKNSTFSGHQLELLYKVVVKLQDQYTALK